MVFCLPGGNESQRKKYVPLERFSIFLGLESPNFVPVIRVMISSEVAEIEN